MAEPDPKENRFHWRVIAGAFVLLALYVASGLGGFHSFPVG